MDPDEFKKAYTVGVEDTLQQVGKWLDADTVQSVREILLGN